MFRASTVAAAITLGLAGCATQAPPVVPREAPQPIATQQQAQQAAALPVAGNPLLRRRIALGRISNETTYGQSLLRDREGDPLGKQVSDLLSKALTDSKAYLVFERPDIGRIEAERRLTGDTTSLVGVDALVVGSLTEFGRKTLGQTGFLSASKRQVAFAKVDLRLVDVKTGHVFFATSGAGEASTETAATLGFGSQAAYDSTLNDQAIRQAVSEAVNRLSNELSARPWQTAILKAEPGRLFIAGGKAQGVRPGMTFVVKTLGETVKSPQSGFEITLPGTDVADIRVEATFGDNETNEGAVAAIVHGSVQGHALSRLVVEPKAGS